MLAAIGIAAADAAIAAGPGNLRLQGSFCNSEAQIDRMLGHMAGGSDARTAVELVNMGRIDCTFVDAIAYQIERAVLIGGGQAGLPAKYRGRLVGIVIGGTLRAVTPPADIFFAAPAPIDGIVPESRL
jgi:hypothetical protein